MPGGFSKELHKLHNTPSRKVYLSTKLKLLCMLNYSHSYGMSKAYVTGSQVRQSNICTYEVLSSNTETEILWVKLKAKTVHPLNLLHSRLLTLHSDFSYSYNFSGISTFLTGQTILISHFIQLHELPEISFCLQYFLSLGNTYKSFTAKYSEQVGGDPAEFDLHNNSNRDEEPILR